MSHGLKVSNKKATKFSRWQQRGGVVGDKVWWHELQRAGRLDGWGKRIDLQMSLKSKNTHSRISPVVTEDVKADSLPWLQCIRNDFVRAYPGFTYGKRAKGTFHKWSWKWRQVCWSWTVSTMYQSGRAWGGNRSERSGQISGHTLMRMNR